MPSRDASSGTLEGDDKKGRGRMIRPKKHVWVARSLVHVRPMAIFSAWEDADAWVRKTKVSAILAPYPIDEAVCDWTIRTGSHKLDEETLEREAKWKPDLVSLLGPNEIEQYYYKDGELQSPPPESIEVEAR